MYRLIGDKMIIKNPYSYTEKELKTITDARIALKQGYDEGYEAAVNDVISAIENNLDVVTIP